MFKRSSRIIATALLIAVMCSISVSAIEARASAYISSYSMDVIPVGSGILGIEFSIIGIGRMSTIGAESIVIREKSGSDWINVYEYDRNDDGMVDTNTGKHGNSIAFYGTAGIQYWITITLFAENSSGSDSRTENFILTAR